MRTVSSKLDRYDNARLDDTMSIESADHCRRLEEVGNFQVIYH